MGFFRKFKILIPSLIAMFITLAMGATVAITYAWSTTNRNVIGEGDTVNVNLPLIVLASDSYEPLEDQTTIAFSDLEANGFGVSINFSPLNVLYPATTNDGITFRYATNVDTNGQSLPATDNIDTYEAVDALYERYFFLEKSFYLVSAYTQNVSVYLSSVEFYAGTENSSLYKSIRLCATCGNTKCIISDNDGQAYPANGPETVASTDPAIRASNIGRSTFIVNLPAMQKDEQDNYYCTPVLVSFRIWIEGQSPYAVVAYSGHAFGVNVDFDIR